MPIFCDEIYDYPCIYLLEFILTGAKYVGQTIHFRTRMQHYRSEFRCFNPNNNHKMISHIQYTYGVFDFDKYFNVTVLERFPEDLSPEELREQLNEAEIRYIKLYDTYDKTYKKGLNYTKGGAGVYPINNAYARTEKNDGVWLRKMCIAYDIEKDDSTMYASLVSASKDLNISVDRVRETYHLSTVINKRFKFFPADYSDRKRVVLEYISNQRSSIKAIQRRCNKTSDIARKTAMLARLSSLISITVNTLLLFIKIERHIATRYPYEAVTSPDVVNYLITLEQHLGWFNRMYNKASSEPKDFKHILYNGKISSSSINKLLVIDIENKSIIKMYSDVFEVGEVLHAKYSKVVEAVRCGKLLNKQYFVYYADKELRDSTVERIRNSVKCKTSRDRSNRYQYVSCAYMIDRPKLEFM